MRVEYSENDKGLMLSVFHLTSPRPSVLILSTPDLVPLLYLGGRFPYSTVCFCISEVRLYLMILEKLEDYEKALGVLRSNLAGKLHVFMYSYIASDVLDIPNLYLFHAYLIYSFG